MLPAMMVSVCLFSPMANADSSNILIPAAEVMSRGEHSNVAFSDGSLRLAAGSTCGTCTVVFDLPLAHAGTIEVKPVEPATPDGSELSAHWPALCTDIITQVRFRLRGGTWTDWQPRNILAGGDMADTDGDGIPDWVSVMRLRESLNLIYADTSVSDWVPPRKHYWFGKTREHGRFTDTVDRPPGALHSLRLSRGTSEGQDTAAMRMDLVPPDTPLTVCGWTKYDLGDVTSMGVMARFHEFDRKGDRVNKYVLLGDDDFHQPSGRSEWRWRALSFRSLPDTTFLNIYPVRMIGARGRAWAANWEVRLGSVFSEWGAGHVLMQESFESLDGWDISARGAGRLSDKAAHGSSSLVLTPDPLSVVTAIQKSRIRVSPGKTYAFRIAMQNDVPGHYEPTHQAWTSAYLEFYDRNMRLLDCCKVMAFRPALDRPCGAAMRAPDGSTYARFMLVASHISYGDRAVMTGAMRSYYDALQLEESDLDCTFTPRGPGMAHAEVPVNAEKVEVRSFLLSRDASLSPSFAGYQIGLSPPGG